jgi:GAF domain-containing protein
MPQQLPLDELTLTLARIKGLLLTEEKVDRAVQVLAQGVRDAFPDSAGAGVSLLNEQGRRTSAGATDAIVLQADTAQYDQGQGPCLTAWATERTVVVHDVVAEDRWPLWTEAVRILPLKSAISSPLLVRTRCLGAMKIYSQDAGAYDPGTARALEKFAATAAFLLDNIQTTEAPQRFSEALSEALASRDTISQARGFLMHQHGISQDQAFKEMLRLARAGGRSLSAVSEEILNGEGNGSHGRT